MRPEASDLRDALRASLTAARARTMELAGSVRDEQARTQFDPGVSPLGWHLGHVAWQEEWWALRRCGGEAPIDGRLDSVYDSFRSAKPSRAGRLPPLPEIRAYMAQVRERTLRLLDRVELDREQAWIFRFLANHERQHAETMAAAMLLGRMQAALQGDAPDVVAAEAGGWCEFLPVAGGSFPLGCDDDPDSWDNERPAHLVEVEPFAIARQPVTNDVLLSFIEAGGYRDDRLWSEAGRRWRDAAAARAPLHWHRQDAGWERWTLGGWRAVEPTHPAAHLAWHEAEAIARWAGARLPTEAEWEMAAGWEAGRKRRWPSGDEAPSAANLGLLHGDTTPCSAVGVSPIGAEDMAGNVWEWTASHFVAWPGFRPDPYRGYSLPWFGTRHRVLRGGCWMTDPSIARTTFRNFFEPGVRVFPTGLRLARGGA